MLLDLNHDDFSSANARQDKIELELGDWHLYGDTADLTMFCHALHGECVALEWHRLPTSRGRPPYRWFNAPQRIFGRTRTLNFRKASTGTTQLNRPLVSGYLEVSSIPGYRSIDGSGYVVRAILSLNPTRFVAHLRDRPNTSVDPAQWSWEPSHRDLLTGPRRNALSELTLDNSDNVLIGDAALLAGSPVHWHNHLAYYYHQVIALLDRCMVTAHQSSRNTGIRFALHPHLNLRSVETYWEFNADNALYWINRASTALRPMGRNFTSRLFPLGLTTTGVDGHALSHSFQLTDEVKCTAYAKTEQRIRVEIQHTLQNGSLLDGQHTSDQFDALIPWLDTIADDAGVRVGNIVQAMRRSIAPIREQATSLDLMTKIARASDDDATAHSMAYALFNLGVIDVRVRPQWASAVATLVEIGVLERSRPRSRQYRVTSFYTMALEQLVMIMGGVSVPASPPTTPLQAKANSAALKGFGCRCNPRFLAGQDIDIVLSYFSNDP